MNTISIIELKEEELENINAAGARSFFKKLGKTAARITLSMLSETVKTAEMAGDLVKKGGEALVKKCS